LTSDDPGTQHVSGPRPGKSGARQFASKTDPNIGTVLADRYKILEVVGKGGMGVVYKANHELMDRMVAVKMLMPELLSDDISVKRFQREAKAACRINHQNIIGMHDFGFTDDGQPYLVMDFLEGESLSDVLKREGQLSVNRMIHIMSQVCDALDHAHTEGVVHRDLKPGNIMLIKRGDDPDFVKVVDFGVAKICNYAGEESQRLTQTGEVFGSPVYMSPEQCRGDKLDARSDIYGMGIVIYEVLTGKLPLAGKNVVETITKHLNVMPPKMSELRTDLHFPERIEKAVFKALQKDPENRQSSMRELKEDLISGQTQSVRMRAPASSLSQSKESSNNNSNNKHIVAGLIGIVVIAIAAAGFYFMSMSKHAVPVRTDRSAPPTPPTPPEPKVPTTTTDSTVNPTAVTPDKPDTTPVTKVEPTTTTDATATSTPVKPVAKATPTVTAKPVKPPVQLTSATTAIPKLSSEDSAKLEQLAAQKAELLRAEQALQRQLSGFPKPPLRPPFPKPPKPPFAQMKQWQMQQRQMRQQRMQQQRTQQQQFSADVPDFPQRRLKRPHNDSQSFYDYAQRREGAYQRPATLPMDSP
jgi:serine/threonine protein kinase